MIKIILICFILAFVQGNEITEQILKDLTNKHKFLEENLEDKKWKGPTDNDFGIGSILNMNDNNDEIITLQHEVEDLENDIRNFDFDWMTKPETPDIKPAIVYASEIQNFVESSTDEPVVHYENNYQNGIEGCAEGYIKNAKFFDEHEDAGQPCYKHICYPKEETPYYFWEERFQIDKCCKYKDYDIVYGTELILGNEDGCSDNVVRCQVPEDNDAPLIPILENGITKCCLYNGQALYPGDHMIEFERCGYVQCKQTGRRFEIIHEEIFENGCCNVNGDMIGDGEMHQSGNANYLCHDGTVYEVVTHSKPASAFDDIQTASNPILGGSNSFLNFNDCESCYDTDQGYFKGVIQNLQNFITEDDVKKIHFVLNGNNIEHKMVAAILASNFDEIGEKTRAYLSYYSYHGYEHGCAFYNWQDQCVNDKCQLAQKIAKTDNIEASQMKTSGYNGFENGADLGFHSVDEINNNKNLQNCPMTQRSIMHHGNFIIFFVHFEEELVNFPQNILTRMQNGCKVAIVTFDWKHFFQAKSQNFASLDQSGQPLVFNIDKKGLQKFAECQLKCQCGIEDPGNYQRERSCEGTFFRRSSLHAHIETSDYQCDGFEENLMVVQEEPNPIPNLDFDLDSILGRSLGNENNDYAKKLGDCFEKFGNSRPALLYCFFNTTSVHA